MEKIRLNKFVAQSTGLSRRSADEAIESGRVSVNGQKAKVGQTVNLSDLVTLDNQGLARTKKILVALNKPVGYVCSRNGQGSPTVYDLLPKKYKDLSYVGRLDKESSGLLLFTNDGELNYSLTHPKFEKDKVYTVKLNKALNPKDKLEIETGKIFLDGKPSIMQLNNGGPRVLKVILNEGRNRQIRRTFELLGYKIEKLHRISFGQYRLADLKAGEYTLVNNVNL